MKVDPKIFKHDVLSKETSLAILPLTLAKVKYSKHETCMFKCRTSPQEADSPTYELTVKVIDGSETLREILMWMRNLMTLIHGLDLDSASKIENVISKICIGQASTVYKESLRIQRRQEKLRLAKEASAREPGDAAAKRAAAQGVLDGADPAVTPEMIQTATKAIVAFVCPTHGLQRVKRYLRRHCRKPTDMSVREFWANFNRINNEEIPRLPPNYDSAQSLQDDECIDILLYALPKSWQSEMTRQGYNPFENSPTQLIAFCEQLENAEALTNDPKTRTVSYKDKSKSKSNKSKSGDLYCMLHGKGNHKTEDCNTLKSQAKKIKSGDKSGSYQSKNKSWNRKDDSKFKKAVKQELKLLMKGKDLNSMDVEDDQDRKRKADDAESEDESMHSAKSSLSSASDSSDASLNMLQQEVKELEFESKQLKKASTMESMNSSIPKKST
jgi:hypothetical protein